MDFDLSEAQRVIAASASEVLAGEVLGGEVLVGVWAERGEEWTGQAAWLALGRAGLLGVTLPAWLDGDELGVLDAAVLLTEVGRAAASVPALATIMLGVLPVVRWGSRELQERLLAGVSTGEVLLTAGVREQGTVFPSRPAAVAVLAATGPGPGTVSGTKVGVPYAEQARWVLVPATVAGGGRAVVVVDRRGPGVALTRTPAAGQGPEYTVVLDEAPVAGLLADHAVDDLYRLAVAGTAALADGALAGALDLTAGYVARREQFGRPLATFQAVAQQIADVYIAARTLHLAALSAGWRLDAGLEADEDLEIAAYWLASQAPAAMRTCHHLHGGIGLDVEYPLPRYSALVSDLTRFVGGAGYRLDVLAGTADVH
jgi:alkylation response protein AidB-like acyl-CoA dehydrogenase